MMLEYTRPNLPMGWVPKKALGKGERFAPGVFLGIASIDNTHCECDNHNKIIQN